MHRPDITTSDEISQLVRDFYAVALVDPPLGPIFDAAGLDLDVHLPQIARFWERQLLDHPVHRGNMVRVHVETHQRTPLTDNAFARWLALWTPPSTPRTLAPVAALAKTRARGAAQTLKGADARQSLPFVE